MTPEQRRYLDALVRRAWRPQLRLEPHEWLAQHVREIPYSPKDGPYDWRITPMHVDIFRSFVDRQTRLLSILKPIQSAGTLAMELALAWTIVNDPGPSMFFEKDDDEAKDQSKNRLLPLFRNTLLVQDLIPQKHLMKQTEVQFKNGMLLWILGAIESNLDRRSIRYAYIDEWHQIKRPGIIETIIGRTSMFEHTSKVMLASQAGDDDQEGHAIHENTDCREQFLICPKCGHAFEWTFDTLGTYKEGQVDNDGRPRLSFDCIKREDGTYNFNAVKKAAVCMCPACFEIWQESPQTRARLMRHTELRPTNPNGEKGHIGIHYESNGFRPWDELIIQYLKAYEQMRQGSDDAMRIFRQKRRAIAWKEETEDFEVTLSPGAYKLGTEWDREAVILPGVGIRSRESEEFQALAPSDFFVPLRIMSVDVQIDHFFVVVASVSVTGSLRIYFRKGGKGPNGVHSWDEVEAIAQQCNVDPQFVFIDAGNDTYNIYRKCWEMGWTALMGMAKDEWIHKTRNGHVKRIYSPNVKPPIDGKNHGRAFYWSNLCVKDMLNAAIKNGHVSFPHDIGQIFLKHLESERRITHIEDRGKRKKLAKPRWDQIGKRPNHYWDCLAQIIVALVMLKLLRYDLEPEEAASAGSEDHE